MSKHFTIKNLPESERPYEKFVKYGAENLSDAELLAIIIKTGTAKENSVDIARQILQGNHNNLLNIYDLSYREMMQYPGIGSIKAIQLKAVAELSKRIARTKSGYDLRLDNPFSIASSRKIFPVETISYPFSFNTFPILDFPLPRLPVIVIFIT